MKKLLIVSLLLMASVSVQAGWIEQDPNGGTKHCYIAGGITFCR